MPYPNEHACRLESPSGCLEYARVSRRSASIGKNYAVLRCRKTTGWVDQAYRYPKSNWTSTQARRHCKAHDGTFEAAQNYQYNIATLQISIPVREEVFEGQPHLVVPVVALVEGVHLGSAGAYYYPSSEIAEIPDCWNGIPLPVFHPEEYGKNVTANTPQLIEEKSVGRLFHVYYDEDGAKLKGELWINIGKAEKIAPEILSIIQGGRQLEVSTALWFDDDGISGTWNGEPYEGTVSNFRPDHLALLPGGEGACSWDDGCGVRVNKKPPDKKGGQMEKTDGAGLKDKIVGALRSLASSVGLVVHDMSHEDLRAKLQRALDALDALGWSHWVKVVFDDVVIYEARGSNPTEAGGPAGVTKLYQVGYSVNEDTGEVKLKDDAKEVREETRYIPVEEPSTQAKQSENQKTKEDKTMEKKELVKDLVACEGTRFTEEDTSWLESLSVEQLEKLKAPEETPKPTGNETPPEPEKKPDGPKKEETPAEQKPKTAEEYVKEAPLEVQATLTRALKRDRATKNALVKALLANDRNKFTEEELNAKDIEELERLTELANVDVDFSAQTGGPEKTEDDDKVPEMEPVFDLSGKKE